MKNYVLRLKHCIKQRKEHKMYNIKITREDEKYEFNYSGIFLIGVTENGDDLDIDFHGNIPQEVAFAMMCNAGLPKLFDNNSEEH